MTQTSFSALLTGLTPGDTYTVTLSGGVTATESVTMPQRAMAKATSDVLWSSAPWTAGSTSFPLGRLPCGQDGVSIDATDPVRNSKTPVGLQDTRCLLYEAVQKSMARDRLISTELDQKADSGLTRVQFALSLTYYRCSFADPLLFFFFVSLC